MSDDDAYAPGPTASGELRCAVCGERIRPGRTAGSWTHVTRVVAACDLDSDHPATPAARR
ncbi:MAG: hypothetical protein AB7V42_08895 [Thermoleophilia bacterium]